MVFFLFFEYYKYVIFIIVIVTERVIKKLLKFTMANSSKAENKNTQKRISRS